MIFRFKKQTMGAAMAAAMAGLLLTACGGGDSNTTASSPPPVGPPSTTATTTVGTITAFGSVHVNGVRFDTSGSSITVDDQPGTETDLKVGQVVTVRGEVDDDGENGSADSIEFDEELEGPIDSIDTDKKTFIVLAQTVLIDSGTVFDDDISPQSIDGLSGDDFVEVSGFVNADGAIAATRIELEDDNEFELQGLVANLDPSAMTFDINGQAVDYRSATLEDFPNGMISIDDFVEVEASGLGANEELLAFKVELKDDIMDGDNNDFDDNFEIEGFITRFESPTDFDVAGHSVTTTDRTFYLNGSANDLAVNVKVEVEGDPNSANVLVAHKVSIRRASNMRIQATVDSIDTDSNMLSLLGIPVQLDDMTQLEDASSTNDLRFAIGDINPGEFLEVRGSADPQNSQGVLAARVERDDLESEVRLRGPVESVNRPTITVLGVMIETGAGTQFELDDDTPISADDFFGALQPGMTIEAKGLENPDNAIMADGVEFESED